VELHEAIRRRVMVRSFSPDPVDPEVVELLVEAALRAPTAGNTGGTQWVILTRPEEVAAYWSATTDAQWQARSARWPGLRQAPVVLLAYASASAYVSRYAESDKAPSASGPGPELGVSPEGWPVPYWTGDAAFGVMTVLLAAVDAGLGACFLGNFRGEAALATQLGVAEGWHLFGSVVLGHPDGHDHASPSLSRPRPGLEARVHRGRW
jgi:nitroreductase